MITKKNLASPNMFSYIGVVLGILLDEFVNDINTSFELGFLLVRSFNRARSSTASLWAAIGPHQVIASPCDADVEAVDVLATWWVLGWQFL